MDGDNLCMATSWKPLQELLFEMSKMIEISKVTSQPLSITSKLFELMNGITGSTALCLISACDTGRKMAQGETPVRTTERSRHWERQGNKNSKKWAKSVLTVILMLLGSIFSRLQRTVYSAAMNWPCQLEFCALTPSFRVSLVAAWNVFLKDTWAFFQQTPLKQWKLNDHWFSDIHKSTLL